MYNIQLKKSTHLHKRYKINIFPIELWQIEQIIIDHGYDIIISKSCITSYLLKRAVFIPNACDSLSRLFLSHELGHILQHSFNTYYTNDMNVVKYEAQADMFALYFLMPKYLFERDLKYMDEWELSEKYGVPVEYVMKRAALIAEPGKKEMRLY